MKRFLVFFSFLFFSSISFATHIIGGYLNYELISGTTYDITLTVYKDCQPFVGTNGDTIVPIGFDNILGQPPVSLGLPDAFLNIYTGNPGSGTFTTEAFTSLVISNVPINDPDSCLVFPEDLCVQKGVYSVTLNLPNVSTNDLHLSYQRCCRNPSSVNVFVDPFGTGISLASKIPKHTSISTNSNPINQLDPPLAFCLNNEIEFDLSATDLDNDSIVYELTTPLVGNGVGGSSSVPLAPPYGLLSYNAGYSATAPFSANPPLVLDPVTGILTGTPMELGPFIVGIKISEFRNGVLISETVRDLRIFIVDCGENIANFYIEDQICTQLDSIEFISFSSDVQFYDWDFGDTTTLADTSSLEFPKYMFTYNGSYTVKLVANFSLWCESEIERTFEFRNSISADIADVNAQCFDSNSFNFSLLNFDFPAGTSLDWYFGPDAIPSTDTGMFVNNVHFTTSGLHEVVLISTFKNCSAESKILVEIYPEIEVEIPDVINSCINDEIIIQPSNINESYSYEWYLDDSLISTASQFELIIDTNSSFDLELIVTDGNGCQKIIEKTDWLNYYENPISGFEISDTSIFLGDEIQINNQAENFTEILYQFGDGDSSTVENPSHIYSDIGSFTIYQTVNNAGDCPAYKQINVVVRLDHVLIFPNVFTPNGDELNDTFFPFKKGIKSLSLEIYDRWGKKVYDGSSQKEDQIWDGHYPNGDKADEEVYNYFCTYITDLDEIFYTKGFVLLLK